MLVLAHVLHLDETSVSINGARWWLRVAGTDTLTAYHLHSSRGRQAVTEFGVLPDYRGIAVHDALSIYDAYPDATHALCGAHLARELTATAEAHPDEIWPGTQGFEDRFQHQLQRGLDHPVSHRRECRSFLRFPG